MSKPPFDKQYTKGKDSEGNHPKRAMDQNPMPGADPTPRRFRTSNLKAAVQRALGQRK